MGFIVCWGGDTPTWSLTLNFSYPLGNKAGRANLQRAQLQLEQTDLALRNQELTIVSQVTSAGLAVNDNFLLLQAAQRWFVEHDVAVVTVVSQGRNREGQRLYQRYGFITDDTALWFHRWFSGSPGAKR